MLLTQRSAQLEIQTDFTLSYNFTICLSGCPRVVVLISNIFLFILFLSLLI